MQIKTLGPILLVFLAALALGTFSAFYFFANTFNGASWNFIVAQTLVIAAASGVLGRFRKDWRKILGLFFLPHLALFALLILGSLEKGDWALSLGVIATLIAAIWLPAVFMRRRKR